MTPFFGLERGVLVPHVSSGGSKVRGESHPLCCTCDACFGYAQRPDTGGRWWARNHKRPGPTAKLRRAAAVRRWLRGGK